MSRPTIFDGMMHEYCVEQGWCGSAINGQPSHVTDFIPEKGLVTAEQFVAWLMEAEGFDPKDINPSVVKHREGLIAVFIRHMGSNIVDASILQ